MKSNQDPKKKSTGLRRKIFYLGSSLFIKIKLDPSYDSNSAKIGRHAVKYTLIQKTPAMVIMMRILKVHHKALLS